METQLENPVLKEEGDALLEMAHKLDRGEDVTPPPSAEQSDTRADTTETDTSSPDITPEKTDTRPRDELGRFTTTEAGEAIPEDQREAPQEPKVEAAQPKPEATQESKYAKAQKEQERKERTWQQIEAEKQQVRAEAQRLAQERQQIEQMRLQAQQPQGRDPQAPEFNSREYANFARHAAAEAKRLREAGDYDEADKQAALAAEASEAVLRAQEYEQNVEQQQKAVFYRQQWEQNMQKVMQAEPEVRDPNSALGKQISALLGGQYAEEFERSPNGFAMATEVAKLVVKAGAASGLEEENKKLKAEVEKLRHATSISGSGPTGPSAPRKLDDMSLDEAGRELQRMAAQWDQAA